MVKEASARLYTSRLPVGPHGAGVTPGSPLYRGQVKMSRSAGGDPKLPREEQVQEIMELKKALAKTRQDLQKTRSRRQSQDNRSSSDEDTYRRDDINTSMTGSLSGMSAVSNKPCLNRELVAKLRSMTETIKMLSTENVSLREVNDQLAAVREERRHQDGQGDDGGEVNRLKAVIQSYEKEVNELGDKVRSLETEMESKDRERQNSVPAPEKDKYKSLARRLKEERNTYKEMVEGKKKEQEELKVEIEKMTEIIVDLRDNCGKLQEDLLQVRLDSPRRVSEKAIQTAPLTRRASFGGGESTTRAKITPKRTRSTVSSASSSGQASPRQSQVSRVIELSKPKIRNTASVTNSPAKGPRIVKPVQRSHSGLPRSCPSPAPSPKPSPRHQVIRSASSSPSKIPSMSQVSKIPTPSRSRIPVKGSSIRPPVAADHNDNDEVLFISEEGVATSDDSSMEVSETRSPFPGRKMMARRDSRESRSSSNTMDVEEDEEIVEEGNDDDFPPPPIPEETPELPPPEFPAPPAPADLEKMSLEAEMSSPRRPEEAERRPGIELEADPMITTPRTLRRADSMRQRMAARRIQRTWKHFYQELEEKKSDVPLRPDEDKVEARGQEVSSSLEAEQEAAIAGVQAAVLSHGARVANLAAARARGGIYTARPWQPKESSETESETEDIIENLQGLIRSQSFRLKTLREEEDVFRVGKVSSIRAKFTRRSPDGASDDYNDVESSDRNV